MDPGEDAERLAAALADRLDRVPVLDLAADELTGRLIDAIAAWGTEQGWRVYRRAASVLPLPPPYQDRRSVLDVAFARPTGPPVVVEVDRTHRRRTIEKLLAEAAAGRLALWVRWGSGAIAVPPPPVRLVPFPVTARRTPAGTVHSRQPRSTRPAPAHSTGSGGPPVPAALPIVDSDPL